MIKSRRLTFLVFRSSSMSFYNEALCCNFVCFARKPLRMDNVRENG